MRARWVVRPLGQRAGGPDVAPGGEGVVIGGDVDEGGRASGLPVRASAFCCADEAADVGRAQHERGGAGQQGQHGGAARGEQERSGRVRHRDEAVQRCRQAGQADRRHPRAVPPAVHEPQQPRARGRPSRAAASAAAPALSSAATTSQRCAGHDGHPLDRPSRTSPARSRRRRSRAGTPPRRRTPPCRGPSYDARAPASSPTSARGGEDRAGADRRVRDLRRLHQRHRAGLDEVAEHLQQHRERRGLAQPEQHRRVRPAEVVVQLGPGVQAQQRAVAGRATARAAAAGRRSPSRRAGGRGRRSCGLLAGRRAGPRGP